MSRRTLRSILLRMWLAPTAAAIAVSVVSLFALGWVEYQGSYERLTSDLSAKSQVAARRLVAEVALGTEGAPDAVSARLASELGVASVILTKASLTCAPGTATQESCLVRSGNVAKMSRSLPFVQEPWTVTLTAPAPTFLATLHWQLLAWTALPIALLLGIGLWTQQRVLSRYLIEPIETLAHTADQGAVAPSHWPDEVAELSLRLQDSFRQRDMALIGQISSGIIHDLKTLLHPLVSAAELARERESDPDSFARRLGTLYRAASSNLPKIQSILETTLDANRRIRIQPVPLDVRETIQAASKSLAHLAAGLNVQVSLDLTEHPVLIEHDPAQVERVITNIVKNAIEAAADASPSERAVHITLTKEETIALVQIEDSGCGLPKQGEDLFTSIRSTKAHGTGLGLVVSRRIIEAHRGEIRAGRSETLGGACIVASLPLKQEGAHA